MTTTHQKSGIRKGWIAAIAAATVALATLSAPATAASYPESQDPIKMTLHNWTGQLITTRIMGTVLQEMGYNIEYVKAGYLAQFPGLESGDLHVAMEIWKTTGKEALAESLATGKTVDLGETGMFAIEAWWYPKYVEEKCPGLPNWEALNDCAEVFATPQTYPKGRYLGGAVTWGGHDEERVEALGLNYEVVHPGTNAALVAELQSAIQRKQPIIAWVYAPNWMTVKWEGEWIEFPGYTEACYDDPSWGPNPDMKFDCGKPRGWIKKVGWAGGQDKWPAAYKAIRNFHITNDVMGQLIAKVTLEGVPLEQVVQDWIANNKDTWKSWIPS